MLYFNEGLAPIENTEVGFSTVSLGGWFGGNTMNSTIPINHFNREKPFYPLVMNYLILLTGYKELALRGVIGPSNKDPLELVKAKLNASSSILQEQAKVEIEKLSSQLSKLIGPLQLKSEFQGDRIEDRIEIGVDFVANELVNNIGYLNSYLLMAAGNLLILAHEICKDTLFHDNGPLWEFLRHCRNAAAHSGRFIFHNNEPRRLAQWGQFQMAASLQSTPLFKGEDHVGLLSLGDPIRLLWDIEQAYLKS
jgi:hypothetical protein